MTRQSLSQLCEPASLELGGDSEIQWQCHLTDESKFFWTYHQRDGKLLVRGPVHDDRWAAHNALLDEIAERNFGQIAEDEDEQHYAAKRGRR